MVNKIPAFQFYPADWRKDPAVQSLSYHDKGIWFEMICLMHESEQRGRLLLNGNPMPDEALARLLGLDKQILTKTLTKLLEYGVASRDDSGALFSRRMVRDETLRKIRTEAGKKGGNPNLVNQNSTNEKKQVNQNSTPSSSSSPTNTFSKEKDIGRKAGESPPDLPSPSPKPSAKKVAEKKETDEEYLTRKQKEFPRLNVRQVYKRYVNWSEGRGFPPKRRFFDDWLLNEDDPLTSDFTGDNENGFIQQNGTGFKNSKQQRDEYALAEFQALERNRVEVERRRLELLRESNADDR